MINFEIFFKKDQQNSKIRNLMAQFNV